MSYDADLVESVVRMLPDAKRKDLRRAATVGQMSVGAAMAMSLAGQSIRDYCPPAERAKVAGLLMRVFLDRPEP